MFSHWFKKPHGDVLHVQIWAHHLKIIDVNQNVLFDEPALLQWEERQSDGEQPEISLSLVEPFAHPRTLVGDFHAGERLLKKALHACANRNLAPRLVIHPMERMEGGITFVEEKALYEMALGAGARDAIVYQGNSIALDQLDFEQLKSDEESAESRTSAASRSLTLIEGVIFLVVVLIMAALITSRL